VFSPFSIRSLKLTLPIGLIGTHVPLKNVFSTCFFFANLIMDRKLPNDFREFLRLLHAYGVKYLLVGGWAVGMHGYPRATNDIDFWVAVEPRNAEQIVRVITEFGFHASELSIALFLNDNQIVRMGIEPVRIEVMTSASGVEFEECYRERIETTLDGEPVSLISLKNLRKNKLASGRLKDLSDLEYLPEP